MEILVVEDSNAFGKTVKSQVERELDCSVYWAKSYSQACDLMKNKQRSFSAALLDITLPDATGAQMVDAAVKSSIPAIVFTADYGYESQKNLWNRDIVDYVIKEGPDSIDYVTYLLKRLEKNSVTKVVVADDSKAARKMVASLLRVHRFNVLEADNGAEALEIINDNDDVKMVITDYNMPGMDGFSLVRHLRKKYRKDEMAIIGISSEDGHKLSARFIKSGANDFIMKPFSAEEFYCRVNQNVDNIENIEIIKEISNRDYLTDLYNRRYFFEAARKLFSVSERSGMGLSVGIIDIDHFKKVNDTYGHEAGDTVLKRVAEIMKESFRASDIVARFGGEEFCVLATNMDETIAHTIFDKLREKIGKNEIPTSANGNIGITVSIGVCSDPLASLTEMINHADTKLYKAKQAGRNKTVS